MYIEIIFPKPGLQKNNKTLFFSNLLLLWAFDSERRCSSSEQMPEL